MTLPIGLVNRLLRRTPAPAAPRQPIPARTQAERLPLPQRPKAPGRRPTDGQDPELTLREVFTPTRPQRSARRLAGRKAELLRIFRAIALDRAHVVLYGERGRGKTSLVNLVASAARSSGYMVGRYTCSADSTFEDIVRGLVRDLPRSMLATPAVDEESEGCEAALPRDRVQPRDLASLPGRLTGRHVVLIADEFDRVEDVVTRTMFADTIKQASDKGAAISFLIVGVSDSLDELVGRHPSIQRNILGVSLPLLQPEEIDEILVQGGRDSGMEFPPAVRASIVEMARGVPYIAQLLGLHTGTEALVRNAHQVTPRDLRAALQRAVEEADPRMASLYQRLTVGEADSEMLAALQALAGGTHDRYARFQAYQQGERVLAAGRPVALGAWERLVAEGVLRQCMSAGPNIFAFAEPMFIHYILMRDASTRPEMPVGAPQDVGAS